MDLNYKIPIKEYYSEKRDEYEYDCKEIVYTPKEESVQRFVLIKLFNDYFSDGMYDMYETKEIILFIKNLITGIDVWGKVYELYFEDIKEYFRDEAIKNGYSPE